jgi:hypothetical protein
MISLRREPFKTFNRVAPFNRYAPFKTRSTPISMFQHLRAQDENFLPSRAILSVPDVA